VDGDIETRTLIVDEGVTFNGKCVMPEPVAAPDTQAGEDAGRRRGEEGRGAAGHQDKVREDSYSR